MQNYSLYYTFLSGKEVKIQNKHKEYLKKRIECGDEKIHEIVFLLIIEHSLYKRDTTLANIYKGKYPYKIKITNSGQSFDLNNLPDDLLVIIYKFIRQMRKKAALDRETSCHT